jgi:hypothetical protein
MIQKTSNIRELVPRYPYTQYPSRFSFNMDSFRVFCISLYVVVTLFIFFLNLPVIIILISGRCMGRKIRNVHILSLSITDCMVSTSSVLLFFNIRLAFEAEHSKTSISYTRCWFSLNLYLSCVVASVLHLCFICADRWWILHNNYSSERKKRVCRFWVIVTATWVTSFMIVGIPFSVLRRNHTITRCSILELFLHDATHQIFQTWAFLLFFGLFFIISSCGWMLHKILNVQRTAVNPTSSTGNNVFSVSTPRVIFVQSRDGEQRKECRRVNTSHRPCRINVKKLSLKTVKLMSHRKAVVTLLILAGCLLFSLAPLCAMCFLMGWRHTLDDNGNRDVVYVVCVISTLNSAFNPLVYAFRVNEVRQNIRALKEKLACCACLLSGKL